MAHIDQALSDGCAHVHAGLTGTPEYNRSIPGALENAIDWASRPYGQNALTRKPWAVIGDPAPPPGRARQRIEVNIAPRASMDSISTAPMATTPAIITLRSPHPYAA